MKYTQTEEENICRIFKTGIEPWNVNDHVIIEICQNELVPGITWHSFLRTKHFF